MISLTAANFGKLKEGNFFFSATEIICSQKKNSESFHGKNICSHIRLKRDNSSTSYDTVEGKKNIPADREMSREHIKKS